MKIILISHCRPALHYELLLFSPFETILFLALVEGFFPLTFPNLSDGPVVVGDSALLGASRAEFGGVSRVVYRLSPEMS